MIPRPQDLNLPVSHWRTGQWETIADVVASDARDSALALPTGAGKSLVAVGIAQALGLRTWVVASTKVLQRQYLGEFRTLEMAELQGRANYACHGYDEDPTLDQYRPTDRAGPLTADGAPCTADIPCALQWSTCGYYHARRRAVRAPYVVTNYAYWTRVVQRGYLGGTPGLLILDEGHAALDAITQACAVTLGRRTLRTLGVAVPSFHVDQDEEARAWLRDLAATCRHRQLSATTLAGSGTAGLDLYQALAQVDTADDLLSEADEDAVFDPPTAPGPTVARWHLLRVPPSLRRRLCREARVVVMSATLTPALLPWLGWEPDEVQWIDGSSTWDEGRRPTYLYPVARVDHRLTDEGFEALLNGVVEVVRSRPGVRGVMHTTSYRLGDRVCQALRQRLTFSDVASRLLWTGGRDVADAVRQFREGRTDAVLCSPAVTTGVDFPHEHCRFQILLKLPFPTTTDRLTRARTARDASYPASLMLQSLVQATGRGMRGPTDWCDSFVLDAHALWAFAKYRHLAPEWFWRTVRRVWHIPAPPSYGSLEVQS